ncbi:Arginase/deacetylase [Mycena pura]|uniref:Arginase/deacetylase n=1 Tax=Mycena pura TaxID=153505 RepID=A0AAD6Y159_9AGAR|nr:Arginase/deacetylase [Mycena pura]
MSTATDASRATLPDVTSSPGAKPMIFLQDACFQHQFIRSRDTSNIVERPERLRAVTVGLAAAISRLEQVATHAEAARPLEPDDLASQLGKLNIESSAGDPLRRANPPVAIVQSSASVDLLNHAAVKFIHGDIDGDVYLENLVRWTKESKEKIDRGESEIPANLAQGDLYLCPESLVAIQGSVGTVCEAVDAVAGTSRPVFANQLSGSEMHSSNRAFVAIRPPGHHCGEDTPSGFCFVNNVAIGAAHANLQHGIDRIVIFDIDLHHGKWPYGNGTQSIAWQINEETYRQTLETEGEPSPSKKGPQVYYSSIHDILSYPCEDGKAELVQAASVSLHGPHGQFIENVHLKTYTSPEHWDKLYKEEYSKILRKAEDFLDSTGGPGKDVLVFISCGMDASEHEMPSMSRHNRRVPTSFFYQFARDACAFSDRYAGGKLISVLEGGYSDRALTSGVMAHLLGLSGQPTDAEWWSIENLTLLEKATKRKRGGRPSASIPPKNVHPWLDRAVEVFAALDSSPARAAAPRAPPPPKMTLRDRTRPNSTASSPRGKPVAASAEGADSSSSEDADALPQGQSAGKKIPRVILRLGPAPAP